MGTVYGQINLRLEPGNRVSYPNGPNDGSIFNLELHWHFFSEFQRNVATLGTRFVVGAGKPFDIYLYGMG
jgi:hypothetical protein